VRERQLTKTVLRPVCLLTALATTALLALSASQALAKQVEEQRVTELLSQLPPGTKDTGVCGARHQGCDIEVTPDGRHVFFAVNGGPLYERSGGRTTLVSSGPLGPGSVGTHCFPRTSCGFRVSEDGRAVAFETPSSLVPEDIGETDVYLRAKGVTTFVSTVSHPGETSSYDAYLHGLSEDGSRVWFGEASYGDNDGLFEWTKAGVKRFPSDAKPALDAHIFKQGASRDGQHVFFETTTPLLSGDTNTSGDIYERTGDGQIKLMSADASGHAVGIGAGQPSTDGSRVIFDTTASLVSEDTDSYTDVYERVGERIILLSPGTPSSLYFLAASSDGTRVFFATDDSLVPQDTDSCRPWYPDSLQRLGCMDIYERSNGKTTLISTSQTSPNAPLDAYFAFRNGISPDGTHVFFSTRERLVPEDIDTCSNSSDPEVPPGCESLYERVGDVTNLVSTGPLSPKGNYYGVGFDAVSADGKRVFFSIPKPLVSEDTDTCPVGSQPPGCFDIYQRYNGTTSLISTGPSDDQGNCERSRFEPQCPVFVAISPDGKRAYFQTTQSLTPDDTDGGLNDIYVSKVIAPGCQPKQHENLPKKCQ
jgi:hypothetical protein